MWDDSQLMMPYSSAIPTMNWHDIRSVDGKICSLIMRLWDDRPKFNIVRMDGIRANDYRPYMDHNLINRPVKCLFALESLLLHTATLDG